MHPSHSTIVDQIFRGIVTGWVYSGGKKRRRWRRTNEQLNQGEARQPHIARWSHIQQGEARQVRFLCMLQLYMSTHGQRIFSLQKLPSLLRCKLHYLCTCTVNVCILKWKASVSSSLASFHRQAYGMQHNMYCSLNVYAVTITIHYLLVILPDFLHLFLLLILEH